ncbi:uncharacterized protein LOC116770761 [Danaus plexippus]|uniref:uncharacterized protein LOC116770761 n=1 Tax=Danaus plexippus TaxID=13037 RepID=UPI002AAF32E7|nr:uncharacterized protein LOC116770761 [Danaus plexippus]
MLMLESCCCCIPLRCGCLVIGYIYLVGAVIQGVLSIIDLKSALKILSYGFESGNLFTTVLITTSAITLIITLFFVIFNIFLLIGLHKNRRSYVKAFLIYNLIFTIIWTVLFFAAILVSTHMGWFAVVSLIILGIWIYFLLTILSYFNEMGSSNSVGQFARPHRR